MTTTKTPAATRAFESNPWSTRDMTPEVPVQRVLAHVSRDHAEEATWTKDRNPIVLALWPHLAERACASMFWNSDSPAPKYADDDARVGVHPEVHDPDTGLFMEETSYWTALPRRAARAMWKLRCEGIGSFKDFNVGLTLPKAALRD